MGQSTCKVVAYSRVSTSQHGQDPEVQLSEIRKFCNSRGWAVSKEIKDHGFSGSTDLRPGLKELFSLVRSREVNCVVVTKLDRLFRSLKHLVSVLDEFGSLGVTFVSINDQIDLSTASGRLMMQIVGAFSEFELGLVKERTLAGLAYARAKGKRLGRPKTRPDKAILDLRSKGLSYTEIQKQLGCERSAIYRALKAVAKTQTKESFQVAEKTRHKVKS